MKSLLKLTLVTLTMLGSSVYAQDKKHDLKLAREIYWAANKTAERTHSCTPGVRSLINVAPKDFTVRSLNEAFDNFNLKDIGFIFTASVERFVDKDNKESMAEHVEFFQFLSKSLGNKCPQISKFVRKIEKLKNSTSPMDIKNTMEQEMKSLYESLLCSRYSQVAEKIKNDIDKMIDDKGKMSVVSAIATRALKNK